MKILIRSAELIIVAALLFLSVMSFNRINQIEMIEPDTYGSLKGHLVVVTDDTQSYAYELFIGGVDKTTKESGYAYEVYSTETMTLQSLTEVIVLTHVDGVIVRLGDNMLATEAIKLFNEAEMKVVVVGTDAPESPRDVYIGTNKFNMGRRVGELAAEAINNDGKIGVILGSEYLENKSIATNNFVNGVLDVVSKFENVSLSMIRYSRSMRAELIMDEILDTQNMVDLLICTDPVDVNRIMRVLVDRNRVGDVKIVASGEMPEILDGIKKKMLLSSMVEDYNQLGAMATEHLIRVISGERVSTYINVPFEIVDLEQMNLQ